MNNIIPACTNISMLLSFYSYRMVSNSAFASLVGIPIGITSSAKGLKIYLITAGIKKYKSITKKKKKKHDEIVLLAKYKLNRKEVLVSKNLFD